MNSVVKSTLTLIYSLAFVAINIIFIIRYFAKEILNKISYTQLNAILLFICAIHCIYKIVETYDSKIDLLNKMINFLVVIAMNINLIICINEKNIRGIWFGTIVQILIPRTFFLKV